jgi:hypothetical protein
MALALAKNLSMPPLRAGQSHPLRTNWPNPFPRTNLPVREPEVARLCLAPGISWSAFVAQGAALFGALKVLPALWTRPGLPAAKPRIISTCGDQYSQLSQNQYLQYSIRKFCRINTCRKMGRGLPGFSTRFPLSRPLSGRFLGLAGVATGLVSKGLIMRRTAYIKKVRISHLIRPQTC